ncbi:hypothetical protein AB1L88_16650 [Tautonia sp. JC769]|uniref:hypothetical protein n=1 Tax=Tautonia sp. JC769 TaxID=3232135 RepID=UPI00345826F4
MRSRRVPKYRRLKGNGLGLVELDGKRIYLGRYTSPEALAKSHRIVREFLSQPEAIPDEPGIEAPSSLNIDKRIAAYRQKQAKVYSAKHGRPSTEQDGIRQALRFLRRHCGDTPRPMSSASMRRRRSGRR